MASGFGYLIWLQLFWGVSGWGSLGEFCLPQASRRAWDKGLPSQPNGHPHGQLMHVELCQVKRDYFGRQKGLHEFLIHKVAVASTLSTSCGCFWCLDSRCLCWLYACGAERVFQSLKDLAFTYQLFRYFVL